MVLLLLSIRLRGQLLPTVEPTCEHLELGRGSLLHDNFPGTLARHVQCSPLRPFTIHAMAVIHVDGHCSFTYRTRRTADQVWLGKGQDQSSDRQKTCEQDQPMLNLLPGTGLLRDLSEQMHIGEVDPLEPPELEEVDEHRYHQGCKGPQECRICECHRVRR